MTVRDRNILFWTGQAGIASLDQLARRFWAGKSEQTALDRLRQLVRAGYLEMHVCDVRRPGETVYTLSEKGYMQFGYAYRERLHIGLPVQAEIKQQLLAQEAYLKLDAQVRQEGGKLVEWKSERELRAESRRAQITARHNRVRLSPSPLMSSMEIPDAQVVISTARGDNEILDIEIGGSYYGNMLWEKATRLGRSERQIIWVCTQQRAEYVQTAVASYPNILVLVV